MKRCKKLTKFSPPLKALGAREAGSAIVKSTGNLASAQRMKLQLKSSVK